MEDTTKPQEVEVVYYTEEEAAEFNKNFKEKHGVDFGVHIEQQLDRVLQENKEKENKI